MGVKGLWSLLDPVGETCPLSNIASSTVAVDLAGWVVEAETSAALAHSVDRPYLRNLVYRTSALLLQHTTPVFVLDGAAPVLKATEMARRRQGGGAVAAEPPPSQRAPQRLQLRSRQRRCARLLATLGVPHLTAAGEAEALCAALDAAGSVAGVVTDDCDAALHGARTVYRNLSAGKTGGQLTRYCLTAVQQRLGLGVTQLRDLALLLGCDYLPAGLPGVGAQTALQLVQQLAGRPLLSQLPGWLESSPVAEMRSVSELGRMPSHCAGCAHPGTQTQHRRRGCGQCGTSGGCSSAGATADCCCEWHRDRRLAEEHAAQLKVRDCARRTPHYLQAARAAAAELSRPCHPTEPLQLSWRRPSAELFVCAADEELGWPAEQSLQLVLPLLARWQLLHSGLQRPLQPLQLLRASRHHHVDCYLISWRCGEQDSVETHEPRALVETALPELVASYLDSKVKKTRKPRKPKQPAGKENTDDKQPNTARTRKPKTVPVADKEVVDNLKEASSNVKVTAVKPVADGSQKQLITDFFKTRKPAGHDRERGPVDRRRHGSTAGLGARAQPARSLPNDARESSSSPEVPPSVIAPAPGAVRAASTYPDFSLDTTLLLANLSLDDPVAGAEASRVTTSPPSSAAGRSSVALSSATSPELAATPGGAGAGVTAGEYGAVSDEPPHPTDGSASTRDERCHLSRLSAGDLYSPVRGSRSDEARCAGHEQRLSSRDSDSPSAADEVETSCLSEDDSCIADLSAIINTITRTHISSSQVIVISDDDDD